MKSLFPNPALANATISATVSSGFKPTSPDGKPLDLALVDTNGQVIAAGDDVAWAAWQVCTAALENFWQGKGHLVTSSSAPGDTGQPEHESV